MFSIEKINRENVFRVNFMSNNSKIHLLIIQVHIQKPKKITLKTYFPDKIQININLIACFIECFFAR